MTQSWSLNLFRIFGIRLELHFTFLILIAFFAWNGWSDAGFTGGIWNIAFIILVFVCVVLHELGHCIVALQYGIYVHRILLLPIGGMAQFSSLPKEPKKELLITLAGPAVNFIIAGILYLFVDMPNLYSILYPSYALSQLVPTILVFNLIMGTFNLLPIFPMDGGRIFRAILAIKFTYLTATKVAVYFAKPLAIILIYLSIFNHGNYLMAALFAFIYLGGELEYKFVKKQEMFRDLKVRDLTRHSFAKLDKSKTIEDAVDLMKYNQPREVVVMDDDNSVLAVLFPEDIKRLAKKNSLKETLKDYCIKQKSILQADWFLNIFADLLIKKDRSVYPVYQHDKLIGVLDTNQIDAMLDWNKLSEKSRENPNWLNN